MGRFKYGLNIEEQGALLEMASLALQTTVSEWLDAEHAGKGVYFRVAIFGESSDGPIFAQVFKDWVGGSSNRKDEGRFQANSAEKLLRLHHHFAANHFSSFQSRIEGLTYTGAIRFRARIPSISDGNFLQVAFSASGLPEMANEAMCVETANLMGRHEHWSIIEPDLMNILSISENPVYQGYLLAGHVDP